MEKLCFEFVVKTTPDAKSNEICLTSITTTEKKAYSMPEEYQSSKLHTELLKTPIFTKIKNSIKKIHEVRSVWITLTPELRKIYMDEDNVQFKDYLLEETDKNVQPTENGITEDLLKRVLNTLAKEKNKPRNSNKIADKFIMDKFEDKSIEPGAEVQDAEVFNDDADQTQSDTSSFITTVSLLSSQKGPASQTQKNQQLCFRWKNYQKDLISVFNQLLRNESLADVTLVCDGQSIKAHKMILSACSPFFESLFIDQPHQHPIIIMVDVKWPELKTIVDFMYTGEINLNQDQVGPFLKIGEMLKVRGLANVIGDNDGKQMIASALQRNDVEATSGGLQNGNSGEIQRLFRPILIEPEKASKTTPDLSCCDELGIMILQQNDDKNVNKAAPLSSTEDVSASLVMAPNEKPLMLESTEEKTLSQKAVVNGEQIVKHNKTLTTSTDANCACSTTATNTDDNQVDTMDIYLTKSDNPWVPPTLTKFARKDEEHTVNKIRGILNKLTPVNFDELMQTMSNLPIITVEKMHIVAVLIIEKAVTEVNFAQTYCRFCKVLFHLKNYKQRSFRTILLNLLENEFYDNIKNPNVKAAKLKPLVDRFNDATDPKEKQEIKTELDYQEYQFRRRAWGTLNFMSEMYKMGLLTMRIVCKSVESLLEGESEDKLEYMCKLLLLAGPHLEIAKVEPLDIYMHTKIKNQLNNIFAQIQKMLEKNNKGSQRTISNRIRFMMQDIVELRARFWDQHEQKAVFISRIDFN